MADIESMTEEELKATVTEGLHHMSLADRIQTVLSAFTEKDELEELETQLAISREDKDREEPEEEEDEEEE